jgi:hypothetical protein
MKSIKQQYIDLKEGKMSQHNFMRSVRMSLPQYITNVTSFKDTVKILKNKEILNEAVSGDPIEAALKSYLAKGYSYSEAIRAVAAEEGIDEETLSFQYPRDMVDIEGYENDDEDAEFDAMIAGAEDGLSPEMYKNQDYYGGLGESYNVNFHDPQTLAQIVADEFGDELRSLSGKAKQDMALSHAYETILNSGHPNARIIARNLVWGYADEDFPSDYISALYDILEMETPEDGLSPEMYKNQDFPGGISEAKNKKEKKELHPNQIHPQELRMGIKVELEHTDDLDKAKKIALDHLAENPFYYTALKLAGVESPSAPKAKAPKAAKKQKVSEPELTDKENAMKPVKGVEKIKASSNKASKETNKVVKGVQELTHTAKTVRGLKKFAATGGKMKPVRLKEDYESWLSQKQGEEAEANKITQATNADGVKFSINDIAITPDGKEIKITRFMTGEDGKMKAMYSTGMFADVYNLDDLTKKFSKPSFRPGVDLGASFDKFKSTLEEIVREVINETFDGRDNLDAENEY